MLIHFAEHLGKDYIDGCIREIKEMGGTVKQQDELIISINIVKRRNYQFVVQFLRQEERVGNLRLEAVDE
jgi:hypothetical protein